jgi:hypothetical protein
MQEGTAIREHENWVQTFGAYQSQRYHYGGFRYRETDEDLAKPTCGYAYLGSVYVTVRRRESR